MKQEEYKELSESFDALSIGLENESICFESHVFGKPFLPKDSAESLKVFSRHCTEINSFLAPGTKLQHHCWMGSTKSLSSAVFLEHGPGYANSQIRIGVNFSNILDHRVIPAIRKGRVWGIDAVNAPYLVPEEGILVLSVYLVFHDEQFEKILSENENLNDDALIYFWREKPRDWKTQFIFCHTFALPAPSYTDSPEAVEVSTKLRNFSENKSLVFQSYHLMFGFPKETTALPVPHKLQVLRLRSMQFQREWGQREKVSEAKKEALLTIGHEFKNALEETGWAKLLRDLLSGRRSYEQVETQQRIQLCLSHLLWAQSLAAIIRSVAKFEEGDKLRNKWLDHESLDSFKPADVSPQYRESIRYLINYIVNRYSESDPNNECDPIEVVETTETELAKPMTAKIIQDLARRAEIPPASEKFLDVERLIFPPLRLDGTDEYAPAFAIVSLLVEPIRNAYKYVAKQRAQLPARFIAWSVSPTNDGIDVFLVNPVVENDQMPDVVSTELISRLAGWLGIGSISSKRHGQVMVSLRPHMLKKQPGE